MTILVLNTGSSSLKASVFDFDDLSCLESGSISGIGTFPIFTWNQNQQALQPEINQTQALELIFQQLKHPPKAIVHRVVHGGKQVQTQAITPNLLNELTQLIPLAPLHQPHALTAIQIIQARWPDRLQIACFDTAFHQKSLKPAQLNYALPQSYRDKGIQKYGFHGLSYQYINHWIELNQPAWLNDKIIIAHLGNGASLCAIHQGQSLDTSMGMTPLDGLIMGTRCGSIDPSIVIYLQRLGLSVEEVEQLLYHQSGLLGLSGISSDVRTLRNSTNPSAKMALDAFALKAAQHIAQLVVTLKSLDRIIFTGGIGENDALMRQAIVNHLQFLPHFETSVIATDENKMMAINAKTWLQKS
jgi:acetate kinase